MRQQSTLAAAVLLLAVAALLPGAAQAYEFDMVSSVNRRRYCRRCCRCCSAATPVGRRGQPAPLPACHRFSSPASCGGDIMLSRSLTAAAVRSPAHPPACSPPFPSLAVPSLPPSFPPSHLSTQVFQTKCIMEDVNEQEEVTGSFRAFMKDHPDQAVQIDARVGRITGGGGGWGGLAAPGILLLLLPHY